MKKLGKLNINPEKLMKNEELILLQGGDENCYYCVCGFVGGYQGACNPVWRNSLEQALIDYNAYCGGSGCTCNGNGCPQWY
jgi:hypothetical protein